MMQRTTSSELAREAIERRGTGERDEARKARAEDATSAFLGGNQRGGEGGGGRESVIESRGPKGVKENEHGSGERGRGVVDGDGQRGKANIISLLHSTKFHGSIAAKERVQWQVSRASCKGQEKLHSAVIPVTICAAARTIPKPELQDVRNETSPSGLRLAPF